MGGYGSMEWDAKTPPVYQGYGLSAVTPGKGYRGLQKGKGVGKSFPKT